MMPLTVRLFPELCLQILMEMLKMFITLSLARFLEFKWLNRSS